jgi:hypothetical protein
VDGKKQTLKLDSNINLGERIKRVYGEGAIILSITKRKTEKPLVNGRSNRVAIAAAYAQLAAKIVYEKLIRKPMIMNDKYQLYSSILAKYGLSPETRVDLIEDRDELEDELYSHKLLSELNQIKILDPDVVNAITKNRKRFNRETIKQAERLLAEDVFYFFMNESRKTRNTYPLFKGISGDIDERFEFLNRMNLNNPIKLLKEKIELESLVPTSSRELSAVILLNSGKSKEWCMEKFKISSAELDEAKNKLMPYLKSLSPQAKEFLDLIKKK